MCNVVKLNELAGKYSKVSDDYVIVNGRLIDLTTGKTPNVNDSYAVTYNYHRYCLRRKDGKGVTSIDTTALQDIIEKNFFY